MAPRLAQGRIHHGAQLRQSALALQDLAVDDERWGGVDIVVSRRVHDELRAAGVSPLELQGLRVI